MGRDGVIWEILTILIVGSLCVSLSTIGTVVAIYYITKGA